MDLQQIFNQDDKVLCLVFLILVAMSIISWSIAIIKLIQGIFIRITDSKFVAKFWESKDLEEAYQYAKNHKSIQSNITINAINALNQYGKSSNLINQVSRSDYLDRNINQSLDGINKKLSTGLTALATIGSTAPFIGLFGTVWGIYHALINISINQQVSLVVVSAPIGEALVATATGLFVAIPGVLFYNAFLRANKNLFYRFKKFAYDLRIQLLSKEN